MYSCVKLVYYGQVEEVNDFRIDNQAYKIRLNTGIKARLHRR